MGEYEKVIKGLECCVAQPLPKCEACPYEADTEEGTCFLMDKMHEDALALLKAQEPRVMTIEEIEQWNQPDVWMEMKDGKPDICGDYLMPMTRMHYEFWCAIIVDGSKHPPALNGDYYGKTWRCWTSRPTDEQREAVKWDG